MFKIALSPRFWAKTSVEFVDADGKKVIGSFETEFKRHDRDEIDKRRADVKAANDAGEMVDADEAFLREVVTGFREIEIDDAEEGTIRADDTEKMLAYLLKRGFSAALNKAFFDNYPKARAKN